MPHNFSNVMINITSLNEAHYMAIHDALKTEMIGLKVSVKAPVTTMENLESRMARQATDCDKLQQDVKVALKNK
jgi:hypothetical protein